MKDASEKITEYESSQLLRMLRHDEEVQKMKKYIQHGTVTTYEHVEQVTRLCLYLNRRFHLGADKKSLIIGAFLHDFYLYDWHDPDPAHRLHGFSHPLRARENAVRFFAIGEKEQKMILSHMWPLTITRIPTSREAWILCIADKYISTRETLFQRHKKTPA